MNLTKHFTYEELIHSELAVRNRIDNSPIGSAYKNLYILAEGLEHVRELLQYPILISSGFRCLELNTLLKSKPTSAHTKGLAADFICPGYGKVEKIMETIVNSNIEYDQCILEFNNWIHIAFPEESKVAKRENLIIDKEGTRSYDD